MSVNVAYIVLNITVDYSLLSLKTFRECNTSYQNVQSR